MRVIVCGGRGYNVPQRVLSVLDEIHLDTPITCIIEGGATGADRLARTWAQMRSVPFITFAADWSYGRKAGPLRNRKMLIDGKPDLVIAFPGGRGTSNMVAQATDIGTVVKQITA